jgi:transposase
MDGLKDMPRSGHPLEFTAQERTEVLAMATRKPEDEGKHFTDWSVRELASHVVEKGIVESISSTTVFRWLREADIKPHKWEYWLNSTDPDFLKK